MLEKGLTQKEFAGKLGVGQQLISFWVTGKQKPTVTSLKKIAFALNVPIKYFIEDTKNADKNFNKYDDKNIELILSQKEIEILKLKNKILQLEKENSELKTLKTLFDKQEK